MHPALSLVGERLPHVREQAAHLFETDDVFRELCDEYRACDEAVALMRGAAANEAVWQEYVVLRLRLEGELLRYLAERPH